jgi:hypothetical protein
LRILWSAESEQWQVLTGDQVSQEIHCTPSNRICTAGARIVHSWQRGLKGNESDWSQHLYECFSCNATHPAGVGTVTVVTPDSVLVVVVTVVCNDLLVPARKSLKRAKARSLQVRERGGKGREHKWREMNIHLTML